MTFTSKSNIDKTIVLERLKKVLFQSMIDIREVAKRKAPFKTGFLRKEIKLFPESFGETEYELISGAPYSEPNEFGTSPYIILPDSKKALAFDVNGKKVFSKKVNHPGIRAQPFMRPALLLGKTQIVQNNYNRFFGL